MHLPDGPQLDLSTQVAKVKAKTRPVKAIIALILAICAAAASGWAHNHFVHYLGPKGIPWQILAFGLAAAFRDPAAGGRPGPGRLRPPACLAGADGARWNPGPFGMRLWVFCL